MMRKKIRALAIDGPAGAGKSTIARAVSRELGWIYVDTGAMFRAVALYFLREGVRPDDAEGIREKIGGVSVTLGYENGEQQVYLNGENVSGMIRTEEVGNMASACSVYPEVRQKLLELQRALAVRQPVVMDGRDIGTVVLPDAETKVYLTASVEVRARRRYRELQEKGAACDIAEIEKDIRERDWRDMHRETAPLRQAEDAVLVDSSCMTAAEVTDEILALVRREEV